MLLLALAKRDGEASDACPAPAAVTHWAAAAGDGGEPAGVRIIARVVHDSAKPGRHGGDGRGGSHGLDLWVAHSTAAYAAAHLVGEALDDEAAVLAEMQAAFLSFLGGGYLGAGAGDGAAGGERAGGAGGAAPQPPPPQPPEVVHASLMAWDHAQPTRGSRIADAAFRLDPARRAGVCGDFFGTAEGAEAAALSGIALAEAMAPLLASALDHERAASAVRSSGGAGEAPTRRSEL